MGRRFRFLEHTADIKFQAFGKTLEKVFENSAYAMFKSMYKEEIKKTKRIKIKIQGKDFESLLYNFLEEFLILLDTEGFFLSKIRKIKIDRKKFKLEAEAIGDNVKNYETHIDIKAVTYSEMFVEMRNKQWITQVVLDV